MKLKFEKIKKGILGILQWVLAISLPLWIYGMLLAIRKAELQPVAAMLILNFLSGFFFYHKVFKKIGDKYLADKQIIKGR